MTPPDYSSQSEAIQVTASDLNNLKKHLNEIYHEENTKNLNLEGVLAEVAKVRETAMRTEHFKLIEMIVQLEFSIRMESIRLQLKLQTGERAVHRIAFLVALSSRIESMAKAFIHKPDLVKIGLRQEDIRTDQKRVLVVDDSKTFQERLTKACNEHPGLTVVGTAFNAQEAVRLLNELQPDVMTMDVEMPGSEGHAFLSQVLKEHPIPMVVITAVTRERSSEIFNALYQGAIDYIPKKNVALSISGAAAGAVQIWKAAQCNLENLKRFYSKKLLALDPNGLSRDRVVGVVCSRGSTRDLTDLVQRLPRATPPILISQKIAPGFSKLLVQELSLVAAAEVLEAKHGARLEAGKVYIAPDESTMRVYRDANGIRIGITKGDGSYEKSGDLLLESLAEVYGSKAVGVLLSGSGEDGAQGLLKIREKKGFTLVQDECDCVDSEVAREAIRLEAALQCSPGDHVGENLFKALTTTN